MAAELLPVLVAGFASAFVDGPEDVAGFEVGAAPVGAFFTGVLTGAGTAGCFAVALDGMIEGALDATLDVGLDVVFAGACFGPSLSTILIWFIAAGQR